MGFSAPWFPSGTPHGSPTPSRRSFGIRRGGPSWPGSDGAGSRPASTGRGTSRPSLRFFARCWRHRTEDLQGSPPAIRGQPDTRSQIDAIGAERDPPDLNIDPGRPPLEEDALAQQILDLDGLEEILQVHRSQARYGHRQTFHDHPVTSAASRLLQHQHGPKGLIDGHGGASAPNGERDPPRLEEEVPRFREGESLPKEAAADVDLIGRRGGKQPENRRTLQNDGQVLPGRRRGNGSSESWRRQGQQGEQ